MFTPYSELINSFLRKVEKDRDFFNYFNLDDIDSMKIANERALGYLDEAIGRIALECQTSVDFNNRDDDKEQFNFELTSQEKFLIPCLMYEYHLSRDIAYLKTLTVNYSPTELRVFDPSNARTTFMEMYNFTCEQNKHFLEEYSNKDRTTGVYIGINYASDNVDNE